MGSSFVGKYDCDVAIIGAGPSGISTAIDCKRANLRPLLIEKGSLTDSIRRFPLEMVFFSTADLLELGGLPFSTANARPTRIEVLNYYRRVVEHFELPLRLNTNVKTVVKLGEKDGFKIESDRGEILSRKVVVATGYFDQPNTLDVPGADLPHVRVFYDEPHRYSFSDVAVIGGGNSAVETALDLYRHGARVSLIHRGGSVKSTVKYWLKPDIENRLREGQILSWMSSNVVEITPTEVIVKSAVNEQLNHIPAQHVIVHIGYRPDTCLLSRCGVRVDPESFRPRFDSDTFETNVTGLYVAGSVACGCETGTIFIENGRKHAQPIVKHILERAAG